MKSFKQVEDSPSLMLHEINSKNDFQAAISQQFKINTLNNNQKINFIKHLKFDQSLNKVLNLEKQSSGNKQSNFIFSQTSVQCIQCIKQYGVGMLKKQAFLYFNKIILIGFILSCVLQTFTLSKIACQIGKNCEFIIQIYFSIRIITKIFLQKNYNLFILILDIGLNCSGYIALGYNQNEISTLRHLKATRAIKLFLIIFEFECISRPFRNFFKALKKSGKILIPAFMFMAFYAIVGLYLFKDLQFNKCRDPNNKYLTSNWTVYSDQVFLCGQKSCPIVNGLQYQCLNPIDYGVQPNYAQLNNIVQGNSLMQYGNIFYSILSTTKQIFITGSSRLMILNKQAMNSVFVLFYYLSFLYLVSYIYLNIFYGLMVINQQNQQKYEQQNNSSSEQKQFRELQAQNQFKKDNDNNSKESQNNINQNIFQRKQHYQNLRNYNLFQNKKITNLQNHKENKFLKSPKNLLIDSNVNQVFKNQTEIQMINLDNKNKQKFSQFKETFNQHKNLQTIKTNQGLTKKIYQQNFLNLDIVKFQKWNRRICIYKHLAVPLCSINLTIIVQNPSDTLTIITSIIDSCFYLLLILELLTQIFINKKYNQPCLLELYLDWVITALCTVGLLYQYFFTQNIVDFLIVQNIPYLWLRALKYLRIFTLLSQTLLFKQAKIIFRIIIQTIYKMKQITLLWFFVLISSSIIGYHLFSLKTIVNQDNQLDFTNGRSYPINFDSFSDSMSFTSLIFFNEEWDYYMFQQFSGAGFQVVGWVYFLVIFGLTFFSKYLMTLTIKVIEKRLDKQKNFTFQQDQIFQQEKIIENMLNSKQNQKNAKQNQKNAKQNQINARQNQINAKQNQKNSIEESNLLLKQENIQKIRNNRDSIISNSQNASLASLNINEKQISRFSQGKLNQILFEFNSNINSNIAPKFFLKRTRNKKVEELKNLVRGINAKNISHSALHNNNLQATAYEKLLSLIIRMVESSIIRYLNLIIAILSCGSYIFFNQIQGYQNQINHNLLFKLVYHTSFIYFSFQMILNMITYGLTGQNSYFNKSWMNCINFLILLIQAFSYIEEFINSQIFTALLTFRAFRILYIIEFTYEQDKNMRLTIVSFIKLIPKIIKLLIIVLSIYGFFAIWFANLYRDRFSSCSNYYSNANIVTASDCYQWGGDWTTDKMNANNFLNALIFLFLLATTQGWSTLMIHISGLNIIKQQQPTSDYNLLIYMACEGFFFVGNMFFLNLFIGLTIYNFNKIKKQVTGEYKLKQQQKMWFNIKSQIYRLKPVPLLIPCQNKYGVFCFNFLQSQIYLIIQILFSLFFMITMSMFTTNQSQVTQKTLYICLIIYCFFHIFSYLIHLIAFGFRVNFWENFQFYFDTFTLLFTIVTFVLLLMLNIRFEKMTIKMIIGSLIALHMMKSISIINDIKFVKKMTSSLIRVLPQTKNMLLIILAVLYIYTIIGMEIFSYLKFNTELNSFDQNYTTFSQALYSLIKFSTMQSPISQMENAANVISPNFVCFKVSSYSEYLQYGQNGCGSQIKSYLFFLSFHIIYSLILISALMAIIFDAYSEVVKQEEALINKFQLQQVTQQWSQYDPQAKGFLSYRDFWLFTSKLMKIYSFNDDNFMMSNQTKQKFLKELNISIYEDKRGVLSFEFHEVIQALTRIYLKQKKKNNFETVEADKLFEQLSINILNNSIKKTCYNSSQVLSLILLKSGLKVWRRKAMEKGDDKTSFQDRFRIGHLFIINKIKKGDQLQNKQKQSNLIQIQQTQIKQTKKEQKKQQKYGFINQANQQKIQKKKNGIIKQNEASRRLSLRNKKQLNTRSRLKNIGLATNNIQELSS